MAVQTVHRDRMVVEYRMMEAHGRGKEMNGRLNGTYVLFLEKIARTRTAAGGQTARIIKANGRTAVHIQ